MSLILSQGIWRLAAFFVLADKFVEFALKLSTSLVLFAQPVLGMRVGDQQIQGHAT